MNDEDLEALREQIRQDDLTRLQQELRDKKALKQQELLAEQAAQYRDSAELWRSLLLAVLLRTQDAWHFTKQELEDAQAQAGLEYELDEDGGHWIRLEKR